MSHFPRKGRVYLHCIPDLVLNGRRNEELCLVRYLLVARNVEEDEDCPKAHPNVKVLRLDLVRQHGARGNLRPAEEKAEDSGLFDLLHVRQVEEVVGQRREGGERTHNVDLQTAEGRPLDQEPTQGGGLQVVAGLERQSGSRGIDGAGLSLGSHGEGRVVEEDVPGWLQSDAIGRARHNLVRDVEHAESVDHITRGNGDGLEGQIVERGKVQGLREGHVDVDHVIQHIGKVHIDC